jgi:hypothetical protein
MSIEVELLSNRDVIERLQAYCYPNKAVDVFAYQNQRSAGLRAINSYWLCAPSFGFPNAVALNGSAWWPASGPWPATLLPLSARHGVTATAARFFAFFPFGENTRPTS